MSANYNLASIAYFTLEVMEDLIAFLLPYSSSIAKLSKAPIIVTI